jgi:hypothetical protein
MFYIYSHLNIKLGIIVLIFYIIVNVTQIRAKNQRKTSFLNVFYITYL